MNIIVQFICIIDTYINQCVSDNVNVCKFNAVKSAVLLNRYNKCSYRELDQGMYVCDVPNMFIDANMLYLAMYEYVNVNCIVIVYSLVLYPGYHWSHILGLISCVYWSYILDLVADLASCRRSCS